MSGIGDSREIKREEEVLQDYALVLTQKIAECEYKSTKKQIKIQEEINKLKAENERIKIEKKLALDNLQKQFDIHLTKLKQQFQKNLQFYRDEQLRLEHNDGPLDTVEEMDDDQDKLQYGLTKHNEFCQNYNKHKEEEAAELIKQIDIERRKNQV